MELVTATGSPEDGQGYYCLALACCEVAARPVAAVLVKFWGGCCWSVHFNRGRFWYTLKKRKGKENPNV